MSSDAELLVMNLGQIAAAVYDDEPAYEDGVRIALSSAGGSLNGFRAAAFRTTGRTVVAFRGTAQAVDWHTNLRLGTGMNTTYFAMAEAFVRNVGIGPSVILCGHSLGGAIAQVVANRLDLPMVSFNAPGVGVLASAELATANPAMTAVRLHGMAASAMLHPVQTVQDIRFASREVLGLNICLTGDVVSRIGLHYGTVVRIPSKSVNPLTEHEMATMNLALKEHDVGKLPARFPR